MLFVVAGCGEKKQLPISWEQLSLSVCKIYTDQSEGTGFYVGNGIIITAGHIIDSGSPYTVQFPGRESIETDKSEKIEGIDAGFIFIKDVNVPALLIGDSNDLKLADPVTCLGYPFDGHLRVSQGIVGALNVVVPLWGDVKLIDHTAPAYPGNSGGPIFNALGEVVGVHVGGFGDTDCLGLFVPINIIKNYIR